MDTSYKMTKYVSYIIYKIALKIITDLGYGTLVVVILL